MKRFTRDVFEKAGRRSLWGLGGQFTARATGTVAVISGAGFRDRPESGVEWKRMRQPTNGE
jgi:hypothetical protein